MKNKMTKLLSILLLVAFTLPAYANSFLQIWPCELRDGKTRADAQAVSVTWLHATKEMKGAENLGLHLIFPEVAQVEAGHFYFVLSIPSLEQWGVFTGNYAESPAQKADEEFDTVATCSGNALWESVPIE